MDSGEPVASFNLLWASERGVKRGRRPSLSREALVRAAIELADTEGIAAVTMQRLAALVDSKAMSLYRYVPSKEVLLDLMWDVAFDEPPRKEGRERQFGKNHQHCAARSRLLQQRQHPAKRMLPRVRFLRRPHLSGGGAENSNQHCLQSERTAYARGG